MGGGHDFDVEQFLRRPLVARVATVGPVVVPVWFLWEGGAFWWLTGSWSSMAERLEEDRRVALVIDTCDLDTGQTHQVAARGEATVVPYDAARARRKLVRYLGPDERRWDPRFKPDDGADGTSAFVQMIPASLSARDRSFIPAAWAP